MCVCLYVEVGIRLNVIPVCATISVYARLLCVECLVLFGVYSNLYATLLLRGCKRVGRFALVCTSGFIARIVGFVKRKFNSSNDNKKKKKTLVVQKLRMKRNPIAVDMI